MMVPRTSVGSSVKLSVQAIPGPRKTYIFRVPHNDVLIEVLKMVGLFRVKVGFRSLGSMGLGSQEQQLSWGFGWLHQAVVEFDSVLALAW